MNIICTWHAQPLLWGFTGRIRQCKLQWNPWTKEKMAGVAYLFFLHKLHGKNTVQEIRKNAEERAMGGGGVGWGELRRRQQRWPTSFSFCVSSVEQTCWGERDGGGGGGGGGGLRRTKEKTEQQWPTSSSFCISSRSLSGWLDGALQHHNTVLHCHPCNGGHSTVTRWNPT